MPHWRRGPGCLGATRAGSFRRTDGRALICIIIRRFVGASQCVRRMADMVSVLGSEASGDIYMQTRAGRKGRKLERHQH